VTLRVILEKRVDPNNRVYFVNHKNRTTQWEDPRIQGFVVLLLSLFSLLPLLARHCDSSISCMLAVNVL